MPYAKRTYKKKPYAPRRKTAFKKAVARIVRSVVPKPEKKFISVTNLDTSIDIGGVINCVSNCAQGLGDDDRTGLDIQADYLDFNCTMSNVTPSVNASPLALRCMIVQDTQMNNTSPNISQVLENVSINAHLNQLLLGRFNVIYDRKFVINPQASIESAGVTYPTIAKKQLHCYYKFPKRNSKLQYSGAASTDYQNMMVYVIFLTDTDECGSFDYHSRIGYFDS